MIQLSLLCLCGNVRRVVLVRLWRWWSSMWRTWGGCTPRSTPSCWSWERRLCRTSARLAHKLKEVRNGSITFPSHIHRWGPDRFFFPDDFRGKKQTTQYYKVGCSCLTRNLNSNMNVYPYINLIFVLSTTLAVLNPAGQHSSNSPLWWSKPALWHGKIAAFTNHRDQIT